MLSHIFTLFNHPNCQNKCCKIVSIFSKCSDIIKEMVFILANNYFINSYSISSQNMVRIQGSVSTHPGICNNTSRVCNDTSAVCIPQNTDCVSEVTDSGCVDTDPWMCCYRPLDGLIQNTGCTPYFGRKCCSYL